jgi:hypothetical protein
VRVPQIIALQNEWTMNRLIPIILSSILASSGAAIAQTDGKQAPATSAPAESSHAPGHDAQSGKPETGEKEQNDLAKKQGTDKSDKNSQKDKKKPDSSK